ncbi:hypothetical protein [Ereboglobus sp. PH5-5]|uniref:hypothetical protein n=1 Tax=Ereboglobus sp. PH5-5 TaxID=2940529 RepID=UPI002405D3FB|nr:hypothetical protein [Ereboglobus sp. PH5-5]
MTCLSTFRKPDQPSEANANPVKDALTLPADAIAARAARAAAETRGFFWSDEFAAAIGRHRQFVSDRCRARVIKTIKGGRPYRIPFSELAVWFGSNA